MATDIQTIKDASRSSILLMPLIDVVSQHKHVSASNSAISKSP